MPKMPSITQITKMREVTDFKGAGTNPRRVFIGNGKKYVIENSRFSALRLHLLSKQIQKKQPNLRLQKILQRKGKLLEQNFLDGRILEGQNLTRVQVQGIGTMLAQLHSVKKPFFPRIRHKHTLRRRISFLICFISRSGLLSREETRKLRRFFKQRVKTNKVICHSDMHRGNIIETSEGLGIIDIGDMHIGYQEHELSKAMVQLGLEDAQREIFLKAYTTAGGNLENYRANQSFWNALGFLDKFRSSVRNYLTEDDPNQKQRRLEQAQKRKRRLFKIIKTH
jgi:aminoglycoside phosphotransferase (APT) family kinase protein